jgi:hypothetical protein
MKTTHDNPVHERRSSAPFSDLGRSACAGAQGHRERGLGWDESASRALAAVRTDSVIFLKDCNAKYIGGQR